MTDGSDKNDHARARKLAFTNAFNLHGNSFLGFFYRKTGNVHVAEELSQQFWHSVYSRFDVVRMTDARLLQRRANDIFVSYTRKNAARAFVAFTDQVPEVADTASRPTEAFSPVEEMRLQNSFWEQFPGANITDAQKNVFWLKARMGYTVDEISQKLSLPASTVHDWIKRVKAECQRAYNRE